MSSEKSKVAARIAHTERGFFSRLLEDSRGVNASRLVKMEIETKDIEVIAEDPQYDVNQVMIHPDIYQIQAVSFYRARNEWTILDNSLRDDFQAIAKLDQGDFFIYNRDNTNDTWLVGFMKDSGPVPFYTFDRKAKKGTFLFDHQPDLNNYTLAPMEPVSFISRDGWGYHPEAQWLANRGYICLQVNFRGSTGYGKEFLNAGNKEWSGKMHHDLVDAVTWAVDQGIADPKRIAIFGWSYGGYAALVGATFTPELFCCAVDGVGISNLITWIRTIPPY